MPKTLITPFAFLLTLLVSLTLMTGGPAMCQTGSDEIVVKLPEPSLDSTKSLEECIAARRSQRSYSDTPLTLEQVSQVLWAAQGITSDRGFRTTPSAGALYPVRLYFVAENVDGLEDGSWLYDPEDHSISLVREGSLLADLQTAAVDQDCVGNAAAALVIAAIPEVTEARYGDRSLRYIDQEVGCICQDVYLQCASLGLGTVAIGAFYDDQVAEVVSTEALPRLIMPLGALPD